MATVANPTDIQLTRAEFYQRLRPENLAPLWEVLAALVTPTPRTPAIPAAWSLDRIKPMLMEAGELISAAEAERQSLPLLQVPHAPGRDQHDRRLPQRSRDGDRRQRQRRKSWRRHIATRRTRFGLSWMVKVPSPPSTASAPTCIDTI